MFGQGGTGFRCNLKKKFRMTEELVKGMIVCRSREYLDDLLNNESTFQEYFISFSVSSRLIYA